MKAAVKRLPVIIKSIQTSKGEIEYNVYDFIQEIEKKPVIWNKTHSDHRNVAIFEHNWNLIGSIFVPFFAKLDDAEKTQIVDELKAYWLVLGKTLIKSLLKVKQGKGNHCHYLRYMEFFLNSKNIYLKDIATQEELQELLNNEIKRRSSYGLPPPTNLNKKRRQENEDNYPSTSKIIKANTVSNTNLQQQGKSTKESSSKDISKLTTKTSQTITDISYCDPMLFCETTTQQIKDDEKQRVNGVGARCDCRQQQLDVNCRLQNFTDQSATRNSFNLTDKLNDPDQAFFESIKPTLRKLNDLQKLEFKIEVLKSLKKCNLY